MDQVPGLQAALEQAFALLEEGAANPDSPWRTPTLATAGAGAPGLRTVVLRRFLRSRRQLEFHTDARSPKWAALRVNPAVSLHGWDAARRVQLRLQGRAGVLDEADTLAIWQALRPQTRATYSVALPPGTPVASPEAAARTLDREDALAAFSVVRVSIDELDWLHLGHDQHHRARFSWDDGALAATWLVP